MGCGSDGKVRGIIGHLSLRVVNRRRMRICAQYDQHFERENERSMQHTQIRSF
jgi:hypothetical protein